MTRASVTCRCRNSFQLRARYRDKPDKEKAGLSRPFIECDQTAIGSVVLTINTNTHAGFKAHDQRHMVTPDRQFLV